MTKRVSVICFLALAISSVGVAAEKNDAGRQPRTTTVSPGEDAQFVLLNALITALPGDVIELQAGNFEFRTELNVACNGLTIRGAGRDSTTMSFKNQVAGSSGIVATGSGFVIEDLSVEDTVGNAIKVLGAKDVTFRNVRVEWTGGAKSTNGAYGIYPVECQNVLIDKCISIGASDAGIYVGQCHDVIVRNSRAERNVAGIEIENTLRADVYDNVATNNSGGLLVFDLPGLNVTNGGDVRLFRNKVYDNNHENFAPKGTMVAGVPAGTGVMLMATDRVEIFDNDITDNQTDNILIVSFLVTERKINDKEYDPYPEAFNIHDNRLSGAGKRPSGQLASLLVPIAGVPFPDIFFDGIVDDKKLVDGKLPKEYQSSIRNNGEATFADFDLADFAPQNLFNGKYKISKDLTRYDVEIASIAPVKLKPHERYTESGNPAVAVYLAAPKKLSEWNFFEDKSGCWAAADDVVPYELNTPLFSDYTVKHRFVRLPDGQKMTWNDHKAVGFPVGTAIAKTFAYPDDAGDRTAGERFLETRVEVHEESGWYGYSYIWNDEQTDADLKLGGGVVHVSWKDEDGVAQSNDYQVPDANQCLSCHAQDDKFAPLGPTGRNLNGDFPAGKDEPKNQLTRWLKHGLIEGVPGDADRPRLPHFDDVSSGSLDDRARAWLEVNCAHCHSPHGSARTTGLDLRMMQTDPGRYGVFKSPVAAGKGSGGRRYDIVPGKPDESILMFRLETEVPGARMPNLARNLAHHESNELIRSWIESMPVHEKQK